MEVNAVAALMDLCYTIHELERQTRIAHTTVFYILKKRLNVRKNAMMDFISFDRNAEISTKRCYSSPLGALTARRRGFLTPYYYVRWDLSQIVPARTETLILQIESLRVTAMSKILSEPRQCEIYHLVYNCGGGVILMHTVPLKKTFNAQYYS